MSSKSNQGKKTMSQTFYPKDNQENHTPQWLVQCHSHNGYVREKALHHLMTFSDDAFNTWFDEIFDVLLQRQNDHIPQVREIAFHLLMNQIKFCHLKKLLANAHRILHLKNQSRSNYQPIHQKLIQLFIKPYSMPLVRAYSRRQGKVARAIYELLASSKKMADDDLLQISIYSRDIAINKQCAGMIELFMDRVFSWDSMYTNTVLSGTHYGLMGPRQSYFILLLKVIPNKSMSIWGALALAFLPTATPAQRKKLAFYMAQKGLTFEDLAHLNKQPNFKILIQDIQHKKRCKWERTLLDFLPKANLTQLESVYYYLKQKNITFEDLATLLINHLGEKDASKNILKILGKLELGLNFWLNPYQINYVKVKYIGSSIKHNKKILFGDDFKNILTKFPAWQDLYPDEVLRLSILLIPEDSLTARLNEALPDVIISQSTKILFFQRWRVASITEYKNYARILRLTEEEELNFASSLPTWEHLFFLIEYIEENRNTLNKDVWTWAYKKFSNQFYGSEYYIQSLNHQRQKKLKSFLADTENNQYFGNLRANII